VSIVPTETGGPPDSPLRIAFSTLAFPDASLASAVSLGRQWGYAGVELRLIDGELIDPRMPAADRAQVKRTVTAAGMPVVAVDSSIRLTGEDPGPDLRRFLELASDWESPLVRVFGGTLAADRAERQEQLRAAARVLEASVPLAQRLGVSKAFVTKLLNGNPNLTIKTMVAIAGALECTLLIDIPSVAQPALAQRHKVKQQPGAVYCHEPVEAYSKK